MEQSWLADRFETDLETLWRPPWGRPYLYEPQPGILHRATGARFGLRVQKTNEEAG